MVCNRQLFFTNKGNKSLYPLLDRILLSLMVLIIIVSFPSTVSGETEHEEEDGIDIRFWAADGSTTARADLMVSDGQEVITWTNVERVTFDTSPSPSNEQTWTFEYEVGENSYMFDLKLLISDSEEMELDVFLQDFVNLALGDPVVLIQEKELEATLKVTHEGEMLDISVRGELEDILVFGTLLDEDLDLSPVRGVNTFEMNGQGVEDLDIGIARFPMRKGAFLLIPFQERDVPEHKSGIANLTFGSLPSDRAAVSLRRAIINHSIVDASFVDDDLVPSSLLFPQFSMGPEPLKIRLEGNNAQFDLPIEPGQGETILIDAFPMAQTSSPSVILAEESATGSHVASVEVDEEQKIMSMTIESDHPGDTWTRFQLPEGEVINSALIDGIDLPKNSILLEPTRNGGVVKALVPSQIVIIFRVEADFAFIGPEKISIEPGKTESIPMELEIQGNMDQTISFGSQGEIPGSVETPMPVSVGPGANRSVDYLIRIEEEGSSGTYSLIFNARDTKGKVHSHTLYVTVEQVEVIDYQIHNLKSINVTEGQFAVLSIMVENTGNAPVNLSFSVTTDYQGNLLYPNEGRVNLGETFLLNVTVATMNGTAGGYLLEINISGPYGRTNATLTDLIVSPSSRQESEKVMQDDPVIPIASAISISLIALIGLAMTESGRYSSFKFFSLFIPLYSRIAKDEVLDNLTREKIYRFIETNPGEHYSEIGKKMILKNGLLAHHLRTLEQNGYIISKADGHLRRFYPTTMNIPKKELEELSWFQIGIVDVVRNKPGLNQKDITKAMDESKQVINYHLKILVRSQIINRVQYGRMTSYYVNENEIVRISQRTC